MISDGPAAARGPQRPSGQQAAAFLVDVGTVVLAWTVVVALENVLVGRVWGDQFVGSWETSHALRRVSPIALSVALPPAVFVVLLGRLVSARRGRAVAALVAPIAGLVAFGVSSGRHLASPAIRVPFVVLVVAAAAAFAVLVTRRVPLDRPRLLGGAGAVLVVFGWVADAFVLPRLYPAFHAALLAIALVGAAMTTLFFRRGTATVLKSLGFVAIGVSLVSAALAPHFARALAGDDNLRRVLVEHAPVLGRAVRLGALIAPPLPLDDDSSDTKATAAVLRPGAGPRALDWTGHDIVVVTIDALRADHVSSYGYSRPTTPNIDRLAARGARFEHAYCPTPHTSYSITSMMTGKYMRPVLALGTPEVDSETWAGQLRRYGFRTAAFYPPAVFFIDEHRFQRMKANGLGFEYRKEEFAAPALRTRQVSDYVKTAPTDKPLFLWVHLFEPHEPYVRHPEHPFGADDVDAYDSEIATADGIVGDIVDVVEKRRPGAVFVISADHGEEFFEHGGRYHGSTVYEEQVRVPLVVVAPGVAPRVVGPPVQTIDLLPTMLAALDIPEPARVRGRDLGGLLAGVMAQGEQGLAFAETDDYTLLARGTERLVCMRKIGSCTLFDLLTDPRQRSPIVDRPRNVLELRRLTAAIERENGKLEAPSVPEALRRCLQGDREAAEDVAALFDDARLEIRREAARCAFRMRAPAMAPQLRRAVAKDEDVEVQRWCALGLLRQGEGTPSDVVPLTRDADPKIRLAAALALAEQGDARGEAELLQRWDAAFTPGARDPGELDEARELLAALTKIRTRTATPTLVRSLPDVRLRPYVAEALGEIGDPRAQAPLLAVFANERYVDVRPKEARALVRLGAREALLDPLRRFAGVPEAMVEAVEVARAAGLLTAARGGWASGAKGTPNTAADVTVTVGGAGPARLLAVGTADADVATRVAGEPVVMHRRGNVWIAELPALGARARVQIDHASAFWIVRRAEEVPPPPPQDWTPSGTHDAGIERDF